MYSDPGLVRQTHAQSPVIVTGLSSGVNYSFGIAACNKAGEGAVQWEPTLVCRTLV